jgi:hypothetical protein
MNFVFYNINWFKQEATKRLVVTPGPSGVNEASDGNLKIREGNKRQALLCLQNNISPLPRFSN